jgi:hypothetical protein
MWSDAALAGTLVLKDGCLMIDDGEDLWIPVFWKGRDSWNGEALVSGERVFPTGSEMLLGGAAYSSMSESERNLFVPAECPSGADQQYFGVGDGIALASEVIPDAAE